MAKSIYLEKAMLSDELTLAVEVSGYKQQWDEIIRYLSETYVDFSQEWKYYGKAWGWTLMLKSKSKTLCYITPAQEYFQVSVIFNDKGRAWRLHKMCIRDSGKSIQFFGWTCSSA